MSQLHMGKTVKIGQKAEQAAAEHLALFGFQVIDRNWSVPKLCEIDLIALRQGRVYFIEVKYRLSAVAGGGLDYIAPLKLRHMQRAAQIWVRKYAFTGSYDLGAIEVSGSEFVVGEFIESIF